ncbi:MAG: adenylate kinase [Saprospiraceae bacterium]|nr:adenylate kinase [Saprospiraceae bacterium]HMW40192.1 adenylate kinase [Saprospiraceae bacterium]HMX87058.1 adenylate kinase [Saprospiraceae bacterium]HMZ41373.1 adenylate kinase [Saprospiraceae bacterium]HNA65775.1 adenylate kinase [Saprospiraceae bacterium]
MKHIILFGPPGSGKGTQAQKLIEKYRLYHISTGDLFRAEIAASSPLGLQAQDFMNKGILVPDEVTLGMLRNKLNSLKDVNGIIYDGFPRTIAQAEALDHMLNENNECINALISLEVTDDEIVHRIMLRGQTSGRADDLDESIIRKRMDEYRSKTSSVFNYYKQMNVTHQVKGIGTVEEIFDNLCAVMDRIA